MYHQLDEDGFPIGICIKKAMTKPRPDKFSGRFGRGILIFNKQTGQERWVNVDSEDEAANMHNGGTLYFHGKGKRPSLTLLNQQYDSQHQSLGEAIQSSYRGEAQQKLNYEQPMQQTQANTDIDEQYLSALSMIMSMCLAMAEDICPNTYTPDARQKIATSLYISYLKSKDPNTPF